MILPVFLLILPGVPRGDHTDASCSALQLSLLCHALPPRHVLHRGQVKIRTLLITKYCYCLVLMGCDVQLLSLCLTCVAIWGFSKILVNKKHFFIFMLGMWEPIVAALLDELPFLRKRRTLVYITRFIIAYQSDFISFSDDKHSIQLHLCLPWRSFLLLSLWHLHVRPAQ